MHHSNEFLLPHILAPIQHEVLIGGLLGDSSIMKDGKYPRMKIDRQARDKPYIEWQYNIFKDLCKSGVKNIERFDKRYDKINRQVSFRTRAVPAFLDYYNKWYPNNIRQVPEDIQFTPLILAVWFADDGCIIHHGRGVLTLKLSTESFGEYGANLLSSKLQKRFNENFPIYRKKKNKNQFFIKTSTCAANVFLKEIQPHIIEIKMERKYNIWKDLDLNIIPIIGKPQLLDRNDFYKEILSLNDFSIVKFSDKNSQYNISYLRQMMNEFCNNKYLEKYESNDKFNPYHYKVTEQGKSFFLKELI